MYVIKDYAQEMMKCPCITILIFTITQTTFSQLARVLIANKKTTTKIELSSTTNS